MGAGGNGFAGINTNQNFGDCSYAHSALQCLLMHPIMNECSLNQQILFNNINRFQLTCEIINLYNSIKQRQTGNSSNFIQLFLNLYNQKISGKITGAGNFQKDPYHFLKYLLILLHSELNQSPKTFDINRFQNLTIEERKNEQLIKELYAEFFQQNYCGSVIFNNFYSCEKSQYICPNCQTYYDCDLFCIFSMDVQKTLEERKKNNSIFQSNLTLDDCLDYYCNNNPMKCPFCNINIFRYVKIFNGKTIIIRFKRNNLGNSCDIQFPIKYNFTKYSACGNNSNNNYILKSIISYKPQANKYFADINTNLNSDLGQWNRYMDSQIQVLSSFSDIYKFEPQILIYEQMDLNQGNNNNNNNNNNNINNNNNGISNPQPIFWNRSTGYNDITMNNALQNNNFNNANNINNQVGNNNMSPGIDALNLLSNNNQNNNAQFMINNGNNFANNSFFPNINNNIGNNQNNNN